MKYRTLFIVSLSLPVLLVASLLIPGGERVVRVKAAGEQGVIARIKVRDEEELNRLVTSGLDLLEMRQGRDLFILTTNEQLEKLRGDGWDVRIDDEATRLNVISEASAAALFRDGYSTAAEIRQRLESQAAAYPNLIELFSYGKSWEKINTGDQGGHPLYGVRLTNRLTAGPKPTLFLMAAIHARELVTAEIATRFIDYLLKGYQSDGDVRWLLDEHAIVVVPVSNPDGRVLAEQGWSQRKNTNRNYATGCSNPPNSASQYGVDLNRNFNFMWGLINRPTEPACGLTYPGPVAASEPETSSLQDLVRSLFPDQRGPANGDKAPSDATGILITLHSYGNLVLWPWGTTRNTAPNSVELEAVGKKLASYNQYKASQAIELYPVSGSTDDWSYGELGIASYTFEIGPDNGPCSGFFPSYSCLDEGEGGSFWAGNLQALLYAARIARAPYQLSQGPTPESVIAFEGSPGSITLKAIFDGSSNGNRAIANAEYYIGLPPWRGGTPIQMNPSDGSFDSPFENADALIGPVAKEKLIFVRARNTDGIWGPVRATSLTRQVPSIGARTRISRSGVFRSVR